MSTTTIERAAAQRTAATRAEAITRWLLGGVAFAAGLVGVAMLLAPRSTGRFFSWSLSPAPLAAFVGACYVASALIFGWAAWKGRWVGQRGLCTAVLGLAAPTLVATVRHHDVFDFGRWQAVAWVLLFIASVTSFGLLVLTRRRERSACPFAYGTAARTLLAALGVVYAAVAVVMWAWPGAVSEHGPATAGPLGLRFVGSWAAFLALTAAYAARHPRWDEARLPVATLVVFPLAMLLATVAHADELRSRPAAVVVGGLLALTVAGLSVLSAGPRVVSPPTRGGAVR